MESNLVDVLTLALDFLYLGSGLIGVLLAVKDTRQRIGGVLLAGESVLAAGLLAALGSQYCFTRPNCITVAQADLFLSVGKVAAGVLGASLILSWWLRNSSVSLLPALRGPLPSAVSLLLAVPLATLVGDLTLIALSQTQEVVVTNPEKRYLQAASGFNVALVIESLRNPTSITFGPDGRMYGSDLDGKVWMTTADKSSGNWGPLVFISATFDKPVGVLWLHDRLYVASVGKVSYLEGIRADGGVATVKEVVTGLPARLYDDHQNNGLAAGPDGRLYFGVGSTTNSQPETHPNAASILSIGPDGGDLRVYARGLRNVYDLAFNSAGDLFAPSNGPAGFAVTPGDELFNVSEGGSYGFPNYYEYPPLGSGTLGPVLLFSAHASPDGIAFYHGQQFPADYQDNAFVATYTRGEVYRVQLVKLSTGKYAAHAEVFASGFLNPLSVAVGPDGALYVADFGTGGIFKIAYAGVR